MLQTFTCMSGLQMYNKQKEIEALEKRQALSKSLQDEDFAQSAAGHVNGAQQREQLHNSAAANGGLYRATSHVVASAPAQELPLDPAAEVVRPEQQEIAGSQSMDC